MSTAKKNGYRSYPGVVDPGQLGLGPFEHEESGQVGSVRRHDDHGESGPHHSEHSGRKTPRRALSDTAVQQHAPRKPRGARQV